MYLIIYNFVYKQIEELHFTVNENNNFTLTKSNKDLIDSEASLSWSKLLTAEHFWTFLSDR